MKTPGLERIVVPTFAGPMNCYLLLSADGMETYVVDPGGDRVRLLATVRARGVRVRGVLLTHGHIDHIGALDAFAAPRDAASGVVAPVPVFLHPTERALLLDPEMNGAAIFDDPLPFDPAALDLRPLEPGRALPLGASDAESVEWMHTPGHTAGSVCYRLGDDLVTGDTLFAGSVGRSDFPTGDARALARSVVHLIDTLPGHVRIHPGHGSPSTIDDEKRRNPFYRAWKQGGEDAVDL